MEQDPNTQGRRAASRATKLRRRKARFNVILMIALAAAAVIALLSFAGIRLFSNRALPPPESSTTAVSFSVSPSGC